jgi:hypothetical protein
MSPLVGKPSSPVNGPRTECERTVDGPLTENRISYLISFLLVYLTFLFIFFIIFDQILVFDVMLQTHSSHRGEAASSPLLRCTTLKKDVTETVLQLHFGSSSYTSDTALPYF